MVRGMGPRLPLRRPCPRRPGLRQEPARPHVPGVGPTPERAAPGIRVVVQRRQPGGPCLGGLAGLRPRRLAGPGLPRPDHRQAAHELRLVGQPQGRRRLQPLRGRVPRDGQHQRLRPVQGRARGLAARAVRRDELDGLLLPVDAAHRPRARAPRPGLGRRRDDVPRAVPLDRPGDPVLRPREGHAVGRPGRVLLRRPRRPGRRRRPGAGALARRPAPPARRRHRPRLGGVGPARLHRAAPLAPARAPRRDGRTRRRPRPARLAGATHDAEPGRPDALRAAPRPAPRRGRVPLAARDPQPVRGLPRRVLHRRRRHDDEPPLRPGRVELGPLRRELELARPGVAAGQRAARRRAADVCRGRGA